MFGAIGGVVVVMPLVTLDNGDGATLLAILLTPFVFVALLVVGILRKQRRLLWIGCTLASFVIAVSLIQRDSNGLRIEAKWIRHRDTYEAALSGQMRTDSRLLRHMDWDDWGFAGNENFAFVVRDPTDSLAYAAATGASGTYRGLPCPVFRVIKLEPHYYDVLFFTNSYWNQCEA